MIRTLAVAALALLLLGGCGGERGLGSAIGSGIDSGAAEEPSSSAASSSLAPVESPPPDIGDRAIVGYYLGDGPRGPVLFREERPRYEPDHGAAEAVGMLSAEPLDPDYRTYWPSGFSRGAFVNLDEGFIDLLLADPSLRDRPASMTSAEAALSIQQVVYTLQAYARQPLPVRFLLGEEPADRLLGVPVTEPVAAAPVLETLSLMSLVTPAEGQVVTGSFKAAGLNNGYEGTAAWQLWREDVVVAEGAVIAADAYNDQLNAWHDRVDVSHLQPGTYLFLASNDEPTDGVDADTDTRTIVVR